MNNADKHIVHWSHADVQKYLNGELSAREMHDLEQQALDDPFLADALEGLQTQPGETIQQDLSELRARLDARVTTKPAAIPWRAIRVAAAVILLVGLGFTAFYMLSEHKQPASVAIAKTPAPSAAANQLAAPPSVAANQTPVAATTPAPNKADSARTKTRNRIISVARSAPRPPAAETTPRPVQNLELHDSLAPVASYLAKDTAQSVASVRKDTLPSVASNYISEPKSLQAVTIRGTRPAPNRDSPGDFNKQLFAGRTATIGSNAHLLAFSGRVLDFNQRPLAGASLTYKFRGSVTGAVTDEKGQFNLYIPQKDTTRQLTVAMVGYEETQYALNTNEQSGNTIYLRQIAPQLNEVVVSGIGAQRKEYMAEPPSDNPEKLDSFWLNTAPAMGRIAYLNYLSTAAKNLPVDTTIHGTESISFRVDKKGALTEFRIERSLSPAHDAGVIRLITEGPPWKMLRGRSARALVNVLF